MKRFIATVLSVLLLVTSFPSTAMARQADPEQGGISGRSTGEEVKTNRWSTGDFPLMPNYSGDTPNATGSTGLKYMGTGRDNNGDFIKVEITQVGKVYQEGKYSSGNLRNAVGWSHLVLHFEPLLFENLDLDKCVINSPTGAFNFSDRAKGDADIYKTDKYSVSVPMNRIFVEDYFAQDDQRATMKLYLKSNNTLEAGASYLIEHRTMGKSNGRYPQVYIRNYIMGVDNKNVRAFDAPAYMCYTGNLSVPYGTEKKDPEYSKYRQGVFSNAYSDVYIDWNTNELHVNYVFETTEDIRSGDRTQFVQLFPQKLLHTLEKRNGLYAKFNHVYKRGDLDWGGDRGIRFTDLNSFKGVKDGQSGFRLRIPNNVSNYNHPWTWVTETTRAYGSDLSGSNGRYMAYSKTHGPIGNHIVFYINPDKFMHEFDNLDDLKFSSFFVTKGSDDQVGGVIKNSESINSLAVTKNMTDSPQIDDIYTDDRVITGNTGYNNTDSNVFVTAKNFKNPPSSKTQLVNSDGKIEFYPENFEGVFADMQKDDKLSFETIYRYANYYKSRPTIEKVKARIIFDKYDEAKDLSVTVPSSDKFRGDKDYKENGLGESNMPKAPTREGYIFKGWATKKTTASEFKDAKPLTDVKQWDEGKAYIFDGTVPVNKSYRVYPVWEEEIKGFTIVLHANDGSNREKKIEVAYDEKLPTKVTMDAIASMEEQYGELAKGGYSTLSRLPNAYATEEGQRSVFGKRDGYNLVGWSTQADNGNVKIEDLFSNMAILAKEGEGKEGTYYMSIVRTKTQGIGQAAAAKLFEKISPDKNNELHLYAAWKPYFDIELTKQWYDSTSDKFKGKNVKEILQLLAHGKQDETPAQDPQLAEPIQVGLLFRTAVTEANDPTITGQANYYLVKGSLQNLVKNGGPLKWNLPSYDAYGKRLSYIAVEFEQGPTGAEKYNGFGQKWTNIWATVADNLNKKPGEVWDNTSISKVQSLVLPKGDGKVDAFSGATVRKLYENGTAITETQANNSTVGTKPSYKTTFYNLKVNLANPTFRKLYDRDTEVKLKAPEDPRVSVVEFDLPEVNDKITFQRDKTDNKKWNRVIANNKNTWDLSNETNYTLTEKQDGDETTLVLKMDLEGKNKYKYLKAGQDVGATYYSLTQNDKSGTSVERVLEKQNAPSLNGLEQRKLETKGSEEFVVIRALAPTKELEQFQAGAVLTLFDASAKAGEEKKNAYKNLDGSDVTATREGSYYVFRIPKSKNPNFKDGDNVAVYGEQEGYNPSRSTIPCKVDLEGPKITADKLTVYTSEEVNVPSAFTTDEDALLTSFEGLPTTMTLSKEQATQLATKWKAEGKAGDTKGTNTVSLVMEDKFGNKAEKDWTVEVVDRPTTEGPASAKQLPNRISRDYSEYDHKILVKGIEGAAIKVYLKEPTNASVSPAVKTTLDSAEQEIFLSQGVGTNIVDKVWITQEEKGKKESSAIEVPMDVTAPASPAIESLKPGVKSLVLTGITDDTTKMVVRVGGQESILTRDDTHKELWKNDKHEPVVMEDGKMSVPFDNKFNPNDKAQVIVLDKWLNPKSTTKLIEDYPAPEMPTILAENKDKAKTTVTGTSKNPGADVLIYRITKIKDPTSGEEFEIRTLLRKTAVENNGTYEDYIVPAEPIGTEIGAVVVQNGKESPMAKTTITQNAGIIPFDPTDPNPTPNPDPKRYVTVTLDPNGGSFAKGTKTSFYVLKTYEVKPADFDQALLKLDPPANKAFDKWTEDQENKTAFNGKTFDKDATIYAGYKANDSVIPFDPQDPNKPVNPDPDKYVTVSLNANGGSFAQGTKSSFYVKKTYTMTTNDFAIAEKGIIAPENKAFNAWTLNTEGTEAFPAAGKAFDKDSSVYAQYREGRDVIPGKGNTKPEGYVTVTFKADAAKATLDGETTYYVNPKGKVKLGGILAPTIKPTTGYAVSYPAWTYTNNQNAASIVTEDTTATASLYNKDRVIPVQDGITVTKPEGYLDVVFSAGANGKLEGTSKFYVKPGTESKDVPAPTPIPNTGYKVKAEVWNPSIPTKYDAAFNTTAQYDKLPAISETPQAGYVMVQFDGGDHGKVVAENGKKTILFVNPEEEIALSDKAPTVKEDTNWSFDKWTVDGATVDLTQATKYAKDTVIKATYTSDIATESKDGFVLVEFKAGDKGTIASGNAKVYVKQNKEVDLSEKAPKIKANDGYTHIGWDKPLKGTFTEAAEINAKYTDPSEISTKPVAGFKHITFKDSEHVKLEKDAVKEYWVNPAKVVSVPAPDVTVDPGYLHIGWSTNLTQKFTKDTEITPVSMESTDVTPNKNDRYTEIQFLAGNYGQLVGLNGKTTYSLWANPEKVVTIQPPQIDANQGWQLTGWLKTGDTEDKLVKVGDAIKGQFPKEGGTVQYIAQYKKMDPISDKPEKGYVAITFNAGSNAHFEGQAPDKRIITYYVNPTANKSFRDLLKDNFQEPNLVYEAGYEKGDTKWTPDLVLDETITGAKDFTANVKSKGVVGTDEKPEPKNWKTIEFRIFEYDKDAAKITGGMTTYKVDPNETVDLTNKTPQVKVKAGYSLDGWSHDLKGKFEKDTVIYALIGGDISTKPKKGFVEVKFDPGKDGKFEEGSVTQLYVRKNTEVDLGARAPEVIANKNYSHSGWKFGDQPYGTDSIKAKFTAETNTITATYNQDIIENPETLDPKAGYARVQFMAGEHGAFEDGEKTNFDVRIAANLKIGDLNKPKVKPDEDFFFTKWDKDNNTIITGNMNVTAEYSKDIIGGRDEDKPVPQGMVRIKFAPGTDGKFNDTDPTYYDVRVSANKTLKDLGKPTVIANDGYTHIGWDKKDDTKLDQNMIVLALYKQTVISNPDTGKEVPKGYVRVTFDPTDKGTVLYGTKVQDVLIAGNKTLGDLSKPTVQGKGNNVFSGWDKKDSIKLDENIPERKLKVTALYNDDMKPVEDPNSNIPKGYARVVFLAGENGEIEQGETAAYDVLIKKDVKRTLGEVKKPKVKANEGYTFKAWDKEDSEVLVADQKLEVKATYNQNVIITDDPNSQIPEGYVRATFKTDGRGTMAATIKGEKKENLSVVCMDVLPKTKTVGELKQNIRLTAKDSNVFTGWSRPDDFTVVNSITIEAQYKGGQTGTPSATAMNVKDNDFTTVKGKAEPGATVIAKVDGVEVGKAEANGEGDYTIEAKKDGKKLPENTIVLVTAQKLPESESKPQTAIVFTDANGDGNPDGDTQAPYAPFVKQPIADDTSIKVKEPVEKDAKKISILVNEGSDFYTKTEAEKDGNDWKVNGQKVSVDKDGWMTIPLPANTALKAEQTVTAVVVDASNNKSAPTYVTVLDKDESAKPTDVKALNQNEMDGTKVTDRQKQTTTVTGKAPAGSTLVIKDESGQEIGKVDKVSDNGEFTAEVKKQNENATIKVTAQEPGKKESKPVEAKVARDVNNDGIDDSEFSSKPSVVTPVKNGDTTIEVKGKEGAKAYVVITDEKGNETKTSTTTLTPGPDGKLKITVPELKEGQKVKVVQEEIGKKPVESDEVIVKPNTDNLDKAIEDGEKITNLNPESNTDRDLKKAIEDGKKESEKAKKDPSESSQAKVDAAEKAIRDALDEKAKFEDAKDKVTEAKKDLDNKDKVQAAQDAIDKMKGSIDPKASEYNKDKADLQKELDKAKLDDVIKKGDEKLKEEGLDPTDKKKLEDAVNQGKDTQGKLNDQDTSNDPDHTKIKEDIKAIEDALNPKGKTDKPTIEKANRGENNVTGTAAPNAQIKVTVTPKNGTTKTFRGEADASGKYDVTTQTLVDGDKIVVTASEPGKTANESDPKIVGVDTSKLKVSIDKADKIAGEKDEDTGKYKNLDEKNPIDKELKEALDNGKKVKDLGDKNDPDTDQKTIDDAKKELDKAIAQKEADKAVDNAKDKVLDPKASNEDKNKAINDAQEKIDAIPGTTNPNDGDKYNPIKKELQDKLDLIKKIKEGEDRLKQDDITGGEDGKTPTKPQEQIDELNEAVENGKKQLDPKTTPKDIPGATGKIDDALKKIDMERIKVGVKSLGVGTETLEIQTSVPDATVVIKIDNVKIATITTSSYGTFSQGLTEGLKAGQKVTLEASKSGYNDGKYKKTVK